MKKVVALRSHGRGMVKYYDPGTFELEKGLAVVLDSEHGPEYAICSGYPAEVQDDFAGDAPLPQILRIATEEDHAQYAQNIQAEREAYDICLKQIAHHELEMALVEVEYTLDRSKLIFYFTADGRIDFRELVKDLAATFRTRIELRQIGVRDEACLRGGIGVCGRTLCCATFMQEFHPVSIKMAKEQNLSMNPNKISGACGRLLCCLRYEEDAYIDAKKRLPNEGAWVQTRDGSGVIQEVNLLKETVKVLLDKGDDKNLIVVAADEVKPIRREKRKND